MTLLDRVVANVAKKTGLTPEDIKRKSPEKMREYLTSRTGKPLKITTEFPSIGRGNVLRDGIISSAQIDREIDALLGV